MKRILSRKMHFAPPTTLKHSLRAWLKVQRLPKIGTFVDHCSKFATFQKTRCKTFFSKNFVSLQYSKLWSIRIFAKTG